MRKGFLSLCSRWGLGVAVVLCALALAHSQAFSNQKNTVGLAPEFIPGEAVVQLKKQAGPSQKFNAYGIKAQALQNALSRKYTAVVEQFKTDPSLLKVKAQGAASMGQLLADIQENENVAFAEPNFIYRAFDDASSVIPNDPDFGKTWAMLNTGQRDPKGQEGVAGVDIDATLAWAVGTGSHDIVVAVIDTGVDYTHEDLKNNIYTNTKEIADNGIDDDGNGFIDDVRGWDFNQHDNDPMDDNRHGTHCSGTIGGEGNNGIGVSGVNWKVRILPIKFLSASGSGSLADAVESIKYATKMGVNIMSNSWGGGGFSQTMFDAIKEAKTKGILFVAAAGNEGSNNDTTPAYPATYNSENVISVAATDNRDQKASWSCYGQRTVHLAAPGVNVYSTVPMNKGKYDTFSGTSMACPHVAGAAALLWSLNKEMTFADIKSRLMTTVDPVRGLNKKTISGGRLNINNAIRNIVPPRDEPPADQWKSVAKVIETPHPYTKNVRLSFEVSHPGARYMRVHFTKIGTEKDYDFVNVKNAAGEVVSDFNGTLENVTSDYAAGDKLTIELTSDDSNNGYGFSVDYYEFIE